MPDQTYVFIDGKYLELVHRAAMRDFFNADGELDVFPIGGQARASRVYFYDSIDYTQTANENEKQWQARIERLEDSLEQIRELPGFFVVRGTVPGRDRGKRREQKEIDTMIAVNMVKHALKGNIQRAVLISGDLDLRPAVETLVEEGVAVEVWYYPNSFPGCSYAKELPAAADKGVPITFRQLHEWNTKSFREAHRVPMVQNPAGAPTGELIKVGKFRDWEWSVELRHLDAPQKRWQFNLWITVEPGHTIRIYDEEKDLVERYVAVEYGPINWELQVGPVRGGIGLRKAE